MANPYARSAEYGAIKEKTFNVQKTTYRRTRDMLALMAESQDAGIATLASLQHQQETLKGVNKNLDELQTGLVSAERTLSAIEKNEKRCSCFACFSSPSKEIQSEQNQTTKTGKHGKNRKKKRTLRFVIQNIFAKKTDDPTNRAEYMNNHDIPPPEKIEEGITHNLDDATLMIRNLKEIANELDETLNLEEEDLEGLAQKVKSSAQQFEKLNVRTSALLKKDQKPFLKKFLCF